MKVKDIVDVIEDFCPLSIQESWDNSGLLLGSMELNVSKLLICFDCTPEIVDEAINVGADMIISHHPLIFKSLKNISPDDFVGKTLIKAISNNIAIYAAHTNADKVLNGVSGAMAKRLNLRDTKILDEEADNIGLGVIGCLPEVMNSDEIISYVKECFDLKAIRTSKPLVDTQISKVALCGGSGSSLIAKAIKEGAQLYISGDISYHHFFVPDNFMIMDIGHFESEVDIVYIFYSLIKEKFPNFAVHVSEKLRKSNPVYYF